jgi:hypothetical protein
MYDLEQWMATLPESTQRLVREFPPGTVVAIDGTVHWVVSYGEDDDIVRISSVDPHLDYEGAMATRMPICAQHLRDS